MDKKRIIKSTCRMCHGICGVNVHLEGDRVVRVTGDKDSLTSKGFICTKGAASPELLYHPDRITHPLRRKGSKGDNQWEKISWDDALNEMAEKLSRIKKESGPEFFGLTQGTGRPYVDFASRFAYAYGTPNYTGIAHICYLPRMMATAFTLGSLQIPVSDVYGFGGVKPACIMIWGCNITELGAVHGICSKTFLTALKNAKKVIVVDPRKIGPAKKADHWLRIRPGADGALALAMIHVIIKENLFDDAFVKNHTTGFNKLAVHVRPFTPAWAAKITRIKEEEIIEAARTYAIYSPASIQWGNAIDMSLSSFQTARSLMILRAITGNIDVPGGDALWVAPDNVKLKSLYVNAEMPGNLLLPLHKYHRALDGTKVNIPLKLPKRMLLKSLEVIKNKYYDRISKISAKKGAIARLKLLNRLRAPKFPVMPIVHPPTFWRSIADADPYRLRALWVLGTNPMVNMTNPHIVEKALSMMEYTVVSDFFLTPTARFADLFLPAATWLEQDDINNHLKIWCVTARKKVAQIGDVMDDREVMIQLAKRLGLEKAFPWENYQHFLNDMLADTGLNFEQFREKGIITGKMRYRKYEEQGFPTPSGKVEIFSKSLKNLSVSPLPVYRDPLESLQQKYDDKNDYPLILSAGGKIQHYFHSEGRQIKSLRKRQPDPEVEIHPSKAKELEINDGDWVWLETKKGRIKMRAKLYDGMDNDIVNAQFGWWFPEENAPEYGWRQSNVNILFGDEEYDPDIGSESLRCAYCRIYRA